MIERDVEAVISGRPRLSASAVSKARDGMEPPVRGKGLAGMALSSDMKEPGAIEGAKVEPVKGIRKLVAERMIQSLQTSAQLTPNAHFELTAAQAYRKARVDEGKSKISINDLIAYAQIQALGAHPELNAHFLGDRFAVFEKVHLGIAVDSPRGLMVPVVKEASDLSLEALSAEIKNSPLPAVRERFNLTIFPVVPVPSLIWVCLEFPPSLRFSMFLKWPFSVWEELNLNPNATKREKLNMLNSFR